MRWDRQWEWGLAVGGPCARVHAHVALDVAAAAARVVATGPATAHASTKIAATVLENDLF